MSEPLLSNVLVPVANDDDAATTARAVVPRVADAGGSITAVYVVEKAGGAPDAASVEQREELAAEAFSVFELRCDEAGVDFDSRIEYDTDVAAGIFSAAAAIDASAVAFTPRKASRITRLLTGDTALSLITENDRPVIVFPDENGA